MAASMDGLRMTEAPEATTGLLIRRPVSEVFEAFVDPEITTRFWFTRGSGRLEAGKQVQWHWDMYGASATVDVREVEQNRRILVDWGGPGETPTTVEWTFDDRNDGTTFVRVRNFGFTGSGDDLCRAACDSTQGFTFALAGLKALLEHGIELGITGDVHPDARVDADGSS